MTLGPGISRTQLPKGFLAGGINSGIRKYRPDLGIIISRKPAKTAGVFTKNKLKAVPVLYGQELLPSEDIRAVIVNSGQANMATGETGVENNRKMVKAAAESLGIKEQQVLTSSTGVIGAQIEIDKIIGAVPELVHRANTSAEPFALAILTTDLVPKSVTTTVKLAGGEIRITGMCKGSGMIHPNMGTMLGYILTDAEAAIPDLTKVLKDAVDISFNMISVDGDTSTNDSVFLMANGESGVSVTTKDDIAAFRNAVNRVAIELAKGIARDGEGATKLIEAHITGAENLQAARKSAKDLITSPLIKTAVHGEDPNWGRLVARIGMSYNGKISLDNLKITMQGLTVYNNGPAVYNDALMKTKLKEENVTIGICVGNGKESATAWGCDLSKQYIEINAEYTT